MSRDIPLDQIQPNPNQAHRYFDEVELQALADNIRLHGQLTAGLVRPVADGIEIVHGERRWRACRLAGLRTFRAEVREMTDAEAFLISLIENVQRDALTPIEEARAYRQLSDDGKTQTEIGVSIGRTQSYVATKLRLLKLHPGAAYFLAEGLLSEGHGKQLLRLEAMFPKDHRSKRLKLSWSGDHELSEMRVHSVLHHIEPEHGLAEWPPGDHDFEAIRLLLTGTDDRQWAVVSVWWACLASHFEMSIADLRDHITNWNNRFLTAIDMNGFYGINGNPRTAREFIRFAQWSLLTHSNVRDIGADFISSDHRIEMIKNGGIPLPAVLCPMDSGEDSPERVRYLEFMASEADENDWEDEDDWD